MSAFASALERWIPDRVRGLLWMEARLHRHAEGSVGGAVLGVWVLALGIGLLLAWPRVTPPGLLFWALPTFLGGLLLGASFGGTERRLGVEEFTLALPVYRSTRYWSRFAIAVATWAALSAGAWIFLYTPVLVRGEAREPSLMLDLSQSCWLLGLSWTALAISFMVFSDWRPAARFERSLRQWPWLFLVMTQLSFTEVGAARGWPIWPVGLLLILGAVFAALGARRYSRRPVASDRDRGVRAPWLARQVAKLTLGSKSQRGLIWGELRTLDGSWGFILASIVLFACGLGLLHEGVPSAYMPWIVLALCLLVFASTAIVMAGYRTDLGIDEFVAGLPVSRHARFRVRFVIGLVIASGTTLLLLAILRSNVLVRLVERLPDAIRRTTLGTEPLPTMFNAETTALILPLLLVGYSAAFMAAARHRRTCESAADNEASNLGFIAPAMSLMVARLVAASSGQLWLGYAVFGAICCAVAWLCYRKAAARNRVVDLPEPRGQQANTGWQVLIMILAMMVCISGFLFLFGVGEADRLGRYYAASDMPIDEYLERVRPGAIVPQWADCIALAEQASDCSDREAR
ncbi:MAG: hypothetical protein AAF560_29985, partial [Acidobacteriota bacterium]